MKTPMQSTSVAEKTVVMFIATAGFMFAAWVAAWFVLSVAAKIIIICVVPGSIYIPVRLLVGASPLPTKSPIPIQLGSGKSRFDFLFAALFMAFLQGYIVVLLALFIFGCILTPIGLLESFLAIKLMPAWIREIFWPIIGAAFSTGVAWAAIRDVKEERSTQ